jgi:hypothetical protein
MSFSKDYSLVDRILHSIAFSNPIVQKTLFEIENDIFLKKIQLFDSEREVFITGLPRAGTTLGLNLLYETGEFATFTYRHMPFILSPLLWNRVTHQFQKKAGKKERAHGDGVQVSFDSPEAFEETIWLTYLKKKIVRSYFISPIGQKECTQEFEKAIKLTIKKLISIDRNIKPKDKSLRYLSKNNANISRISVLRHLFPNSTILIFFRNPAAHISSLIKQHVKFSEEHRVDNFSKKYMKWIGHFEFGENFKPINFDDWINSQEIPLQINNDFWLKYWTACYGFALKNKNSNVLFFDFDRLLSAGESSLKQLADYTEIFQNYKLIAGAKKLRSPTTEPMKIKDFSEAIWKSAKIVYEELVSIAI